MNQIGARLVWTEGPFPGEVDCLTCGEIHEECVCPTCQVCGGQGDPFCYKHHGLAWNAAQREKLKEARTHISTFEARDDWADETLIDDTQYLLELTQ